MENYASTAGFYDILASRKAEEAACRRFQAAAWLESLVGPLGLSGHPSEKAFVSRLRNGLICAMPLTKFILGQCLRESYAFTIIKPESQPLPAYQYFENVRNFLVAVEELKLPAFEASDLERVNNELYQDVLEAGSAAKVVDCLLALKTYHECKQMNGGNGFYKPIRSPMVVNHADANRFHSISSGSCRRLDMSALYEKPPPTDVDIQKIADLVAKTLAEHVADTKENIDGSLLMSLRSGNMDLRKLVSRIMSSCTKENPELKSMIGNFLKEKSTLPSYSTSEPINDSSELVDSKCCQACMRKGNCKHRRLFQMHGKELVDLKALLAKTKREFENLQFQFQTDVTELGYKLQEMSTAALGYHKVLKENRNLYNMVQDLKENIRVYCRIRPAVSGEKSNVIDFVGEDASLVILDSLKPRNEGKFFSLTEFLVLLPPKMKYARTHNH